MLGCIQPFSASALAIDLGLELDMATSPTSAHDPSPGTSNTTLSPTPPYEVNPQVLEDLHSDDGMAAFYTEITTLPSMPLGSAFADSPFLSPLPGPGPEYDGVFDQDFLASCGNMGGGGISPSLLRPMMSPHMWGGVKDEPASSPTISSPASHVQDAHAASEDGCTAYAGAGIYPKRLAPSSSLKPQPPRQSKGGTIVPPRPATLSRTPTDQTIILTPSPPFTGPSQIDTNLLAPPILPHPSTPPPGPSCEPQTPRRQIRATSFGANDEFKFETVPPQEQRTDVQGENAPPPWTGIKRWENFTELDVDFLMTGVAPSGGRGSGTGKKKRGGAESDDEFEFNSPLASKTKKTPRTPRKAKSTPALKSNPTPSKTKGRK